MERHDFKAAVFLHLEREGQVFLMRRYNTGWEDGKYTFASGHIEEGEKIFDAGIRELSEEAGVIADRANLSVVHVMHNKTDMQYINFFLKVENWSGEPKNMEPEKCDDIGWFDLDNIPDNTLALIKDYLQSVKDRKIFSELGF